MASIKFTKGTELQHGGETVTVIESLDFDTILVRAPAGHHMRVKIVDLVDQNAARPVRVNEVIDPVRARKVEKWKLAVRPLIDKPGRTRADVEAAGKLLGVSADAVYDALRRFQHSGKIEDLAPRTRNGGRGKPRLSPEKEKIIEDCLAVLLTRRQHTKRHFYRSARAALTKAGIEVSKSALTARIDKIPTSKWFKAREGYSEAKRKLSPLKGKHPKVQRPFQLVQMDHWTADVEILSSDRLHLIGRPFATLITDAKTKVIPGFNLGIDHPGGIPTSLAMISMLTRKDDLLRKHDLQETVSWPYWGTPNEIGTDNGSDFTGLMFTTGCENYNITLTHRPIGAPQYGAFIERLNLAFATWAKDLPGATGSNSVERKKLRPEMTAAFTLDDLEKHIILLIDEYHDTVHSGIGMTPRQAYHQYYYDDDGIQLHPLPEARVDDLDLRVDWYPIRYQTLQRYGVMIDHLQYYGEEISSLVTNRKKGEKFEIRRNPYDVTEIFLRNPNRDPKAKRWLRIPCSTLSYPRISIFEHDALINAQKAKKLPVTAILLSEHFYAQQRHIAEAVKRTKRAQREEARRQQHDKIRKEKPVTSKSKPPEVAPVSTGAPPPDGRHETASGTKTDGRWAVPPEMTPEFLLGLLDV